MDLRSVASALVRRSVGGVRYCSMRTGCGLSVAVILTLRKRRWTGSVPTLTRGFTSECVRPGGILRDRGLFTEAASRYGQLSPSLRGRAMKLCSTSILERCTSLPRLRSSARLIRRGGATAPCTRRTCRADRVVHDGARASR